MKNVRSATTPHQTPPILVMKSTPDVQEVRRRAYELYEQRGGAGGSELDDWLRAESEVTQQKAKGGGA